MNQDSEDTEFKREEKIIKDRDFLPFVGMTSNLGRAEFVVCPKFKRGKLVELFMYPLQQENVNHYYRWQGNGKNNYTVQSYEQLDEPKLWMHFYCKEHKCQSFRMYVPNEANYIWFSEFSDSITIGFTKTNFSI
jgi:bisphosphoglycerate-dependent phosphoglycerate mutase